MNMFFSLFSKSKGSELGQLAAICIGCIPSFITGLIIAWPSPSVSKILEDKERYNITKEETAYFGSINCVCPIIFSLFISKLSDIIGRKRTLMLSALPHAICWLLKALCHNIYAIYAARAIGGLGDTFMYISLPMYIGEISTPKVRGVWGNGLICSSCLGLFCMNCLGSYCTIQVTAFVCFIFPVLFFFLFSFMPESPYFYAMHNRDDETINSLKVLRGNGNVLEEWNKLKMDVQRQMSEPRSWKDIILIPSNRRAVLAGVFLRASQNFTGVLSFPIYAQVMFERAKTQIPSSNAAILYTGISALCYIIAANFADKLGRRKSYILSLCLTSIPLFLEGIYFLLKEEFSHIDVSSFSIFPLIGMIVFIVLVSLGVGLVPTLMLGELFSASIKVKGLSIVTTFSSLTYFAATNTFYYVNECTGLYGPFFVFGCCNLLSALIASYVVPETKGKTLEQIQQELKKKDTVY